jgi:hypothetical protein
VIVGRAVLGGARVYGALADVVRRMEHGRPLDLSPQRGAKAATP